MQAANHQLEDRTAIRTDLGAIFVSLELSRSTWLITSLSPGGGEKMSKPFVRGVDVAGLLMRFSQLREKVRGWTGKDFPLSRSRRRDWMASGSIECWRGRASKATLPTPPRLRLRVGAVWRRPTGSTERRRLFEHCWHTNEANRASVRWSRYRHRKMRIAVGSHASAGR